MLNQVRLVKEAVKALNSLQSNVEALQVSKIRNETHTQYQNISLTQKYLARCGVNLDWLEPRAIHVAGTKGKGSTCALTESILRAHGFKTGFYSSPHLYSVSERIRINGAPLSKSKFAEYFWSVYNKLNNNQDSKCDMPPYFKFLTVMAFDVFIKENVDVAVIEVGIGGEYCCTNVLKRSPVVGISSLGFDHVNVLGDTIEKIAWQKAGIMKPGCVAFTADNQPLEAMEVLQNRALERQSYLSVVPPLSQYYWPGKPTDLPPTIELNGSLAIQLAHAWMQIRLDDNQHKFSVGEGFELPSATVQGILSCDWRGRFQRVSLGNVTFYLDGAHTKESMLHCSQWYKSVTNKKGNVKRVLIFNITGPRNAQTMFEELMSCGFDYVIFTPNVLTSVSNIADMSYAQGPEKMLSKCLELKEHWAQLGGSGQLEVVTSVESALSLVDKFSSVSPLQVLVTGSVHLVGNVLMALDLIEPSQSVLSA